jgi:hypothetical protein
MIRRVANRAGVRVLSVGRQELVAAPDAAAFVDSCLAERCRILGVEGFHIVNDHVEPDMDAIADFSAMRDSTEAVKEARQFLGRLDDPDLAFAFILVEASKPAGVMMEARSER